MVFADDIQKINKAKHRCKQTFANKLIKTDMYNIFILIECKKILKNKYILWPADGSERQTCEKKLPTVFHALDVHLAWAECARLRSPPR